MIWKMDAHKLIGLLFLLSLTGTTWAQVNCTSTGAGRFADTDDTTCQNYTLCVLNSSTSTYLSYNYVCPTTSVFNPATAQCTTNYVCPNTTTTTNTTASVCTADGFVADPNVTDCSSYIQCVNISGTFSETTITCPTGTYYDPATTLCESDYVCDTTTTFNCTTAGRFADQTDTTCQDYFFCVADSTGAFTQYNYTCPTTSVFNPTTSVCTTTYTCTTA